jgi:hypothetical protein
MNGQAVLDNHDVRADGRSLFIKYIDPHTDRRFSYNGISFYLLDTGNASLGKVQLDNLMDAAASDPNPKVFCGHVPLYGGPDMFYFSLKDPHERALLVDTMVKNKVGLYLAGHLHLTHKLYRSTRILPMSLLANHFMGAMICLRIPCLSGMCSPTMR